MKRKNHTIAHAVLALLAVTVIAAALAGVWIGDPRWVDTAAILAAPIFILGMIYVARRVL